MSKPKRVVHMTINGRERSAAQIALETDKRRYSDYVLQYQRAGLPVPEDVLKRARELGVMA